MFVGRWCRWTSR